MKAEGGTEHKQGLFNYKFPVSDLGGADLNDLVAQVWARDVANNYGHVIQGVRCNIVYINNTKKT